jgi:hypothetical protein
MFYTGSIKSNQLLALTLLDGSCREYIVTVMYFRFEKDKRLQCILKVCISQFEGVEHLRYIAVFKFKKSN